ncbi:MAG: lysophospholipid acyltransferase family protein [Nitrospirae bacterium]|nr:lysophospholipid acyltransferase family protein [Nitrospirota bacterium]
MDIERWKARGAAWLLRTIGSTLRIETPGFEDVRRFKAGGQPVLYAFFHGALFPLVYAHRKQGVCILTSLSRDGELLSRVLLSQGYQVVRGSSTRGGIRGLLEMKRIIQKGSDGGIAVDGPKGPRHQVKPGVLFLAEKTGAPIIPIGAGFSKAFCFRKSWDASMLPFPFSRVVLQYGEPMVIKAGDEEAGKAKELQEVLFRLTEEAERMAGGQEDG